MDAKRFVCSLPARAKSSDNRINALLLLFHSSMHADVKASGWHVDAAVGIWPVQNNFSLFAKPGALFSEVKTSASATGAAVFAPGANTTPKHSESNWRLGIGAGYDFTPTIGARVEWERANKLGDDNTGKGRF